MWPLHYGIITTVAFFAPTETQLSHPFPMEFEKKKII